MQYRRIPAVAVRGHLMWTRTGTVWATWRLRGMAKGLGGSDLNAERRKMHRALVQGIVGEYMLLGLAADVSTDETANQMLEGVDVSAHPEWAEEVLLTTDYLDENPQGKREFWLAAPLRPRTVWGYVERHLRQAELVMREMLSLPHRPPSQREVSAAMHAAAKIEDAIPETFKPRRATTSEQIWVASHAMARGLQDDADLPAPRADRPARGAKQVQPDAQMRRTHTKKSFPLPHVDEQGQTDERSKLARFNPFAHKYVKVTNTRTEVPSYQVMMTLAGSPKGGWNEDLDWVGALDELGVNADWAFRVHSIKARDAKRRNSRIEVNIADQMNQQDGTAAITGSGGELDEDATDLAAFHQALGASEKEVSVDATFIVAVGADTPDEAKERAKFTRKYFSDQLDFEFDIPLGSQEALWWAMMPGVPAERVVREYAELTTGTHFGSLAPLTSTDLGDARGFLFAENNTSGTSRPVLLDLWGQITGDVSGSVGIAGEPGGGKSVAIKIILGAVYDRGGRFLVIDRTSAREYGRFAQSLDQDDAAVVDLISPRYSLDPLRVFGPRAGASLMLTLCATLLGVNTRSEEGVLLARLLSARNAERKGLTSAAQLLAELERLGDSEPVARQLAGLMDLYASTEFGAVLFDEDLPPLDLDSRGIVFLTAGVELPTREEIENPNLFREMPLKKIFGNGMYALLTHIAETVCFGNPDELALFAADEFAHITANTQNTQRVTKFLRDGRKHGAPILVASQDARDFGDDITRSLIVNRILTRQRDLAAAEANLEWFHKGFGSNPELVATVTEDLSPLAEDGFVPLHRRGEALFRDAQGRMGKIRTLVSRRPERAAATLSTPKKTAAPASESVPA